MGLFEEKKGLVLGVANERSIAWAIAKSLYEEGAKICLTYQGEKLKRRIEKLQAELDKEKCITLPCDVSSDEEIKNLKENLKNNFEKIDFIVHSIAFAPKEDLENRFLDTSREGFKTALEISAYSLVRVVKEVEEILSPGAGIVTLTYQASERVVPRYNVMAQAKAALEVGVRYLAYELGPKQIRVNAISAGPINTLAARGISGFLDMLSHHREVSPFKRNITAEEVANTAIFLLSSKASGITGNIIYVDAGYHIVAP